jgi:hypothetical protein
MEEMECTREDAVEIIGGEEEEDEESEIIQVVLIPTASDDKTKFTTIFEDTTIEPLENKLRLIMDGVHTAAGVRKAESEHMVHWGRRCCGSPCSRIVRICALVKCPVGSKLTSSGGRALQAARSWELKK